MHNTQCTVGPNPCAVAMPIEKPAPKPIVIAHIVGWPVGRFAEKGGTYEEWLVENSFDRRSYPWMSEANYDRCVRAYKENRNVKLIELY